MTRECPEEEILRLLIPSRLEFLGILDKVVEGVAEELDIDRDSADAIAIAVIEAGTNAIQHGHRDRPGLCVDVQFELRGGEIVVWVKDQGPGFDLEAVERELQSADLLRCRGRGIQIMRSLMDEVAFDFGNGEGTAVKLVKRLTGRSERLKLGQASGD